MKKIFSILTLLSLSLSAQIIECMDINDMNKYKEEGVLFLYDIDNTLVTLTQDLGCDHWFQHRLNLNVKKSDTFQRGLDKTLREWMSVQHLSQPMEVQPGAWEVIKKQQEEGVMMMGFTTRGVGMSFLSPLQLDALGIDFSKSSLTKADLTFEQQRTIIYREGILFTAATHKGTTLFKFLDIVGVEPKKVVFVNDKWDNLRAVEETCEEKGVPFIGLRFGVLDERVANFNPQLADKQLEAFQLTLDLGKTTLEAK